MKLKIYTDGGARGNPGPAAAGYVITDEGDKILEEGGLYLGETTNNQAEYRAVKLALGKADKFEPQAIDFYVDSQLVEKQLTGQYRIKNADLKPLIAEIQALITKFPKVTFRHVRREFNKLADKQVNIILDSEANK